MHKISLNGVFLDLPFVIRLMIRKKKQKQNPENLINKFPLILQVIRFTVKISIPEEKTNLKKTMIS